MHLSGVICSLVDNIPIPKKFNYKNIILTHKKTYEYLYDILEIIEEPFHIRFSDSDIAKFDYDYQRNLILILVAYCKVSYFFIY